MKDIVIFGAGGFGQEVYDTIERINDKSMEYNFLGFIDTNFKDDNNEFYHGKILGGDDTAIELAKNQKLYGVIAISSSRVKKNIIEKMKEYILWENIIDPSACISVNANLGIGNVVQPNVFISSKVKIGNHCIINVGSVIGHDATIDDYTSIMPCCNITGNVYLKESVYIGGSACIIPEITVESECVVGAGAVVNKDLKKKGTYVGVPAKLI